MPRRTTTAKTSSASQWQSMNRRSAATSSGVKQLAAIFQERPPGGSVQLSVDDIVINQVELAATNRSGVETAYDLAVKLHEQADFLVGQWLCRRPGKMQFHFLAQRVFLYVEGPLSRHQSPRHPFIAQRLLNTRPNPPQ